MIGMLVSALYSVVDAYFAGWLGTSQQGAIAVVFPVIQLILGLGMMFGVGGASYIARLLGKNNKDKANQTASTSLFTSLFVGVVSIVVSLCFLTPLLRGLGATETILPYAKEYAIIYITGSIFNIFNVTMNGIVTAEGRTKLTMLSMILGGGLNCIFDPIFMFGFSLGIKGAAISTVIAQLITSFIYFIYIFGKKGTLRFSIRYYSFDHKIFKEILKVGIPVFVYQLLSSISMSLVSNTAKLYGDSAVAAFGDATRLMTLGTYVVFGFLKGFQPAAGYNYGAKNYKRVKALVNTVMKWSTIFCAIVAFLFLFFSRPLMSIFTKNDTELINIGAQSLRANGTMFALFGFQQVAMSLFLAFGKGLQGGLLSISRQGLFFIPAILIFPGIFGLTGIVWVQPAADLCTVVLSAIFMIQFYKDINLKINKSVNSSKDRL